MNRIIDYDILTSTSVMDLVFKVKSQLKEGWIPWGGPFSVYDKDINDILYYQAIAKHEHYNQT